MVGAEHQCCYREQVAYTLYSKFCEPRLYRLAAGGDWDKIPARCRSHPKEAAFLHRYAPNDTALHRVLRAPAADLCQAGVEAQVMWTVHEQRVAAIEALLEVNRQAAVTKDYIGRTPLHLACMDLTDGPAAARMLVEAYPGALLIKDVEGRTPVHFLLQNDQVPLDLLQLMLDKCPSVVSVEDMVHETPIKIVKRRMDKIVNGQDVLELLQSVSLHEDAKVTAGIGSMSAAVRSVSA